MQCVCTNLYYNREWFKKLKEGLARIRVVDREVMEAVRNLRGKKAMTLEEEKEFVKKLRAEKWGGDFNIMDLLQFPAEKKGEFATINLTELFSSEIANSIIAVDDDNSDREKENINPQKRQRVDSPVYADDLESVSSSPPQDLKDRRKERHAALQDHASQLPRPQLSWQDHVSPLPQSPWQDHSLQLPSPQLLQFLDSPPPSSLRFPPLDSTPRNFVCHLFILYLFILTIY